MKLYQLGKGVYHHYRTNVRNNENITLKKAQRKLTRNVLLSFKISDNLYVYGNLHIFVEGNTIVKIDNVKNEKNDWFYFDRKEYVRLNRLLGIK